MEKIRVHFLEANDFSFQIIFLKFNFLLKLSVILIIIAI